MSTSEIGAAVEAILEKDPDIILCKPLPTAITLYTRLKIIAEYERTANVELTTAGFLDTKTGSQCGHDIDTLALGDCVKRILIAEKAHHPFITVRVGNSIILDEKKITGLARRISKNMTTPSDLAELKVACSTKKGRRRYRLYGGGKKSELNRIVDVLVYGKMSRYIYSSSMIVCTK